MISPTDLPKRNSVHRVHVIRVIKHCFDSINELYLHFFHTICNINNHQIIYNANVRKEACVSFLYDGFCDVILSYTIYEYYRIFCLA